LTPILGDYEVYIKRIAGGKYSGESFWSATFFPQIAFPRQWTSEKRYAQLRSFGYEVPPDEAIEIRGVQHISKENYVRYFFSSDEALAQQIANKIRAMGIDVQTFSLVGAPGLGEIHPRNFEFRLGSKYNP
jgi:hypothetical protein